MAFVRYSVLMLLPTIWNIHAIM